AGPARGERAAVAGGQRPADRGAAGRSPARGRPAAPYRAVAGGVGRYTGPAMIVLGINETHCATAAVLRDGRIVGCASEERFSRLKNDAGYPRLAIDALLEECGVLRGEIDVVALSGARAASREWLNRVLHDDAYAREY